MDSQNGRLSVAMEALDQQISKKNGMNLSNASPKNNTEVIYF